jgi:LacI family repressor for deo operon, udp, cdd, tsx, nupC, and nupG
MKQKATTIQDVARAAQVSTATVSRALSHPDLVSEPTRRAVSEAIRATGYRANRAARNLRMQRAGAVLVLVPNLGKPFYSQILAGISQGFADSDDAVLIADTESRPLQSGELAGYFRDRRIDGVICLDGGLPRATFEEVEAIGAADRIVFLCEWVDGLPCPSVRCDNAQGARLAIDHLHALGHRRIAHVTGPAGNVLTAARRDAMVAECARLGLPARPEWIIPGDFSLESGERAAAAIAAMSERPTAVFCSADMVAIGLIAGLRKRGLSVPGDISVVGFDGIELSEVYMPSLTTIRQDRLEMGRQAAALLRARLESRDESTEQAPGATVNVGVALLVRDSTASPPPTAAVA